MKTWLSAIKMLTLHLQNPKPCTSLGADMHFLLHARMLFTLHSVIERLCGDSRRSPEKRII